MSRIVLIVAVLAIATTIGVPQAFAGAGNGQAYNFNWFRDADGDGIPNGLDEDWTRPLDGTGYQLRHGFGLLLNGPFFGGIEDSKTNQEQYRHRNNQPETPGDGIREHKRFRYGSCN